MEPTTRMLEDALRFMGVPRPCGDEGLLQEVRGTFARLEPFLRPRSVRGRFPVSPLGEGEGVRVAGAEIWSRDLAGLMSRSRECYLMAVTLGPEVDRQILRAQRRGMAEGMALDACASVLADDLCDGAEAEIAGELEEDEALTRRFSPGYGDAPLEASEVIIAALDATRSIGLSMTRSLMMTPVKSITALIGVIPRTGPAPDGDFGCGGPGCAACARRDCLYRERGRGT